MKLRQANLRRLENEEFDVLVVGGGINGAVSAACLAARGVKVALVDRGDFAGFTSQHSSNLAWGGIKYLESFEFELVRKLCVSRNHLIQHYPSTVKEIRFFVTHEKSFRHGRFKLFLGSLLYWVMGSFFTRAPKLLSLEDLRREEPHINLFGVDGGFEYSDAYFHDNDARFVWSFIRHALDFGAACVNYTESIAANFHQGLWHVRLRDVFGADSFQLKCRALINACGPYVDEHNLRGGVHTANKHVFSKGIHLIVPRITPHERALAFFADDGRLFFAIPMGGCTAIGTTDTKVDKPETTVTDNDRTFVLSNINRRFKLKKPLSHQDIIAERRGVRPLVCLKEQRGAYASKSAKTDGIAQRSDFLQMSRKHEIEADYSNKHLSIFGGKLTDCINVGEEVALCIKKMGIPLLYPKASWYGEPHKEVRERFYHQAKLMDLDKLTSPTAPEPLSIRLWRRYGYYAFPMLEAIRADKTKTELYIEGAEYTKCEIEHAARNEMVVKLDDFLRRRSKIAMVMSKDELKNAPGLYDVAREFFGPAADERIRDYFEETEKEQRPHGGESFENKE